jgi:photosystem II stability/assembly factor-like uncharacterized protein
MGSRLLLAGFILLLLIGSGLTGCTPEQAAPEPDDLTADLSPEQEEDAAGFPIPLSAPPRPELLFAFGEEAILFQDRFDNGSASDWILEPGWEVKTESGNYFIAGSRHSFARPRVNDWSDYRVEARFKLVKGAFHLNLRESLTGGHVRYFVGVTEGSTNLNRQISSDFFDLARSGTGAKLNQWHTITAELEGNNIKIYLDGMLALNYTDSQLPLLSGIFSFEALEESIVYIDDITVQGMQDVQCARWVKTGGPSGGLGYDVRIHPLDKKIMFVTDNPSGVNKSYDGGANWVQKNDGITARSGSTGDRIPIFCLTIDPNNPDIVWAGTQFMRGIYKSTDGGETWVKKDKGISEWDEITFRGFSVHPQNSDIVFAGAEIGTGILGVEFDKAKGKIYKTRDGGESWRSVWQGGSLARFVLFDPTNPDILYASTGIFDREAYNDVGVGVLKSTDGGETWRQINKGIDNLFVGFLEMHPHDPRILYAAAGNNIHHHNSGVFKTTDGGETWRIVLRTYESPATVVTISPSNPEIVYAGTVEAFYSSDNGGETWQKYFKMTEQCWGPPGVRAGVPISAVVDPQDPLTIFANNYGGGVFKSTNGVQSWEDSSNGYTGAELHQVVVSLQNSDLVYTIGRSGPFRSLDGGKHWEGLAFGKAAFPEWAAVAINPQNNLELLISDEHLGAILSSDDGGRVWKLAFQHPVAGHGLPQESRHGFSTITYAPSNPDIIYAGMRKCKRTIYGDFPAAASFGIYKSINGGVSWNEKNSGIESKYLNINDIAVHPRNPDIVYAATWRDGIFKTTDGGESWLPINNGLLSLDVRSLAIDPKNPDIVYAGMADGVGIFKTSNGGELWQAINSGIQVQCPSSLQRVGEVQTGVSLETPSRITSSGYYAIPWTMIESIVIDPVDPRVLYAADVDLGVYVSTDGGENWFSINEGLTNRIVFSLALSADGWILYAATSGGGIFRLQLW